MPTTFLDLPAELRYYTYELTLSELLLKSASPWTAAPYSSGLAAFTSLTSADSPIGQEVILLFVKKYSSSIPFYFDDVRRLYEFKQWASRRKDLQGLRFCLRTCLTIEFRPMDHYHRTSDLFYFMGDDAVALLVHDSAWRELATSEPDLEDSWNIYWRFVKLAGWETPFYDLFRKHLPTGFVLRKEEHLRSSDPRVTSPYLTIEFPPTRHNLRLTVYQGESPKEGTNPVLPHIMELSGKLQDLTFAKVDVALLCVRVYHARDSAWGYTCSRSCSPDLDQEERDEMDADSWGVPDIDESESGFANEEED